ncbi:MAG TPA: DNA polymerase III subunit delta [Methylomirabilota bacterium]|nr:DNA polymerase III subunit delta [Methylomirabilota bacterium]
MPSAVAASGSLVLVQGDDEFAVRERARQIHHRWCEELGGMDHEIIDAQVGNSDEALRALNRLREALNTLPFLGRGKAVWLKDCTFLGDERTAASQAVTESLAELADDLKRFDWANVRLLISAGKVDKRRTFFKTIEKLGTIETFAAWSAEDDKWVPEAETWVRRALQSRGQQISEEALGELIAAVGPSREQLAQEVEKVSLHAGTRKAITLDDVQAVVTRHKQARAFALAEAVAERNLPKVLRTLDEELWSMQFDKKKSGIGLLYGLIAKVRSLILLKEMIEEGWLRPERDYNRFKTQLERVPREKLPQDKRFNPLAGHPFVVFKSLAHVANYSREELVRAMSLLLDCNRRLVSSALDESLVLQQTLVKIVGRQASPGAERR